MIRDLLGRILLGDAVNEEVHSATSEAMIFSQLAGFCIGVGVAERSPIMILLWLVFAAFAYRRYPGAETVALAWNEREDLRDGGSL